MKSPFDQFLAAAKTISLDEGERRAIAQSLGIRVRERNAERLQPRMGEKQFFRAGKKVSLTASERAMGKEYILNRLEHPTSSWWTFSFKSFTTITAAVLVVVIGGAGASYAAENALPGDFLYPVKVHVNEEMKAGLMKDKESSARWQAVRAERRLQEAEALARKSALTEKARSIVAENFKMHSRAVKTEVASLQAENNEAAGAVGMDFEAVLRAHSHVLGTLGEEQSDQKEAIGTLIGDIREVRMDAEEENVLASLKKTPVAKTVLTDSTLNRARAEVVAAEKSMKADASPEANESLEVAREALADAEETSNVDERMKKARAALRTAKEAGILATVPEKKGDARATVKLNAETYAEKNTGNDAAFGAEVRMRITKRTLEKLGEKLEKMKDKPVNEDVSIRTETRMTGAKQLLDIATMQMEAGQDTDALEASDMALKHAEAAEKTVDGKVDIND